MRRLFINTLVAAVAVFSTGISFAQPPGDIAIGDLCGLDNGFPMLQMVVHQECSGAGNYDLCVQQSFIFLRSAVQQVISDYEAVQASCLAGGSQNCYVHDPDAGVLNLAEQIPCGYSVLTKIDLILWFT